MGTYVKIIGWEIIGRSYGRSLVNGAGNHVTILLGRNIWIFPCSEEKHFLYVNKITGWWFGCHFSHFPINIGNFIVPIDYFSEGWPNHQPDDLSKTSSELPPSFRLITAKTAKILGGLRAHPRWFPMNFPYPLAPWT